MFSFQAKGQTLTLTSLSLDDNPICSNAPTLFKMEIDPSNSFCYYDIDVFVQYSVHSSGPWSSIFNVSNNLSTSGNNNITIVTNLPSGSSPGYYRFYITYKYDSNCGTPNCNGDYCNKNAASSAIYVQVLAVSAGPDRIRGGCCGSVTIGSPAISGAIYLWSPSTGLSSTTVAQPSANPATTTVYTMQITYGSTVCTDQVQVSYGGVSCCRLGDIENATHSVFPNPASESVTVTNKTLISSITIYDLQGRNIKEINGDLSAEMIINLAGMKPGVYILGIVDGDGNIFKEQLRVR